MDPIIGGALISAGSGVGGGLFSSKSSRKQAKKQLQFQKDLAQRGIRWRVKDAKAAGLHPLYALGANIPQSSPITISDSIGPSLAQAGQDIGRAVAATSTPQEKLERAMALRVAQANLDESDARRQMYLAAAARDNREANAAQTFPIDFGNIDALGIPGQAPSFGGLVMPEHFGDLSSPMSGMVETSPNKVPSERYGNPGVAAGRAPFFSFYALSPSVNAYLPFSQEGPAESIESIPLWMWPAIINYNRENLNPQEFVELANFLGFGSIDALSSWADSIKSKVSELMGR